MIKTYILNEEQSDIYKDVFKDICEITNDINDAKLIIVSGEKPVHPSIYGCKKTGNYSTNIVLDRKERKLLETIDKSKVILGLGDRGSSMISSLNYGRMIQKARHHNNQNISNNTHDIYFKKDSLVFATDSYHQQIPYPFCLNNEDYEILAVNSIQNPEYYNYYGDKIEDINSQIKKCGGEPEIIKYKKKDSPVGLSISSNLMITRKSAFMNYIKKIIVELCEN